MNINGGTLEFDVLFNNGQIDRALEETKKRVQGFSVATAAGGAKMEAAYQSAARFIEQGFETIGNAIGINETAITNLQKRYNELGAAAAEAFMKGDDNKYRNLTQQQSVIQSEINERKKVVAALNEQDAALLKHNQQLEEGKRKIDNAANAQTTFRTQLRKVIEELAMLEENGRKAGLSLSEIRGSEKFRELQQEAGRLTNAMGDARAQARILSHDNAGLQGVISAVSGVTGAFTVAQGVIGLFGEKNEDLQKIMLRVQSLMAITMGMQQVANTLNKDSALMIKLNAWWLGVKAKAQITDTAAAAAGTAANIGLSGAFRLVGAAIKSIPVFGWIAAGIGVLIGVISLFSSKAREAKKATEEFYKAVAENASKPIATISRLSTEWAKLGDNLEAKQKFVKDNKQSFEELGISVKGVYDAERLLNDPKHVQSFINAQIAKAKAMATLQKSENDVKDLIEAEQKLEAAKQTPKVTRYYGGGQFGGGGFYEIDNPEIAKWEKKTAELNKKIQGNYETAIKYEQEGAKELEAAGVKGVKGYAAGTVGALEQAISEERDKLKDISDPKKYKEVEKNIANIQKQIDAITGGNKKEKKTKKEKDPVIERMEQAKKAFQEYFKWVNAGYQNEAKQEFSELLKGGKTYIDYLKKMKEDTSLTKEQIHQITNEIAQETNTTILGEFENSLQEQLNSAHSIMEMLNVVEQKRKDLENDDSGLKEQKTEILDKQQEDVSKKAADETNQLLQSYSDYLQEKINFELQYGERKKSLDLKLEKETNEERRKIILAQLAGLEKDREKYAKQTGNENYDTLIQEYRSFEQKKLDITDDFNKKKKVLEDSLNSSDITESQRMRVMQSLQELEKEYKKSLSDLSVEILQQSDTWKKLFTDLDKLTVSEMLKMKKTIEAEFKNLNLSPEALKALREQLDSVTEHVQKKNPFAALKDALEQYKNDPSSKNLKALFSDISASIDLVKGSLDAVVNGLKDMGLAGDEETQQLLGDISKMVGAAGDLAMGIATGNPLQIIQGGISLITSAFDVFNSKDRAANRSIRKHAEAISALESSYKSLEQSIKNALGTDTYKNQKAAIQNMRQQQAHLQGMWKAEQDKKKTDNGKVNEYKEKYAELGRQIEDMIAEIAASITQTTAKDLANQLADALVEAYGKGEDAAKAFEEVSRKVMQNAVKNALKLQFLEKPLQKAIAQLQKDMGFDDEGNGTFDGLTQAEQDRFKNAIASIGSQFNQAMGMYKDLFKDLEDAGDPTTSLAGAIKGASQQSIDLLAGQTNAVRVNQVESIEILRNILIQIILISANTGKSSKHLESIDSKINSTPYDPLRSQGITG
jgi:hypothetical protein